MKVVLGQINTTPGDFEGNVKQILEGIDCAALEGADMVVFPECSICGYLTCDKMYQSKYITQNRKYLNEVSKYTEKYPDLYVVVGYIGKNNTGKGKPFANLLAVLHEGTLIGKYQKQLLPFYDVFDEGRYFEPGARPLVLTIKGKKVGFCICEDIWNDKGQDDYSYSDNPVSYYFDEVKVDILVNISSSPFAQGKHNQKIQMLKQICRPFKTIVYVNQKGGQDELVFDGRSCVIYDGNVLYQANKTGAITSEAEYHLVDTEQSYGYMGAYNDNKMEVLYNQLILGLRDYIHKTGFKKVVIGSSGGIDSAVVIALASAAIGAKNVTAIRMPSKWSSDHSLDDAHNLHENLGCNELTIPIDHEKLLNSTNETMKLDPESDEYNSVADENIQARLRGMIVMHHSNATGSLLLTTGNKTENAVGYFTLYGDACGGFNPIKDLYKTQVYEIAKYINTRGMIFIPENIIDKAPSAELKPGQTDESSLLPYDILDLIVKSFVEDFITDFDEFITYAKQTYASNETIDTWVYVNPSKAKQEYERILGLMNKTEYKRRQVAPGIKVSKVAFGTGRRLPIVSR